MSTIIESLQRAVRLLGGPHRATKLYAKAYVGKVDKATGLKVTTPLARSTLETWLAGTLTERGQIVAQRMVALAAIPANRAPKPNGGRNGARKTKRRKDQRQRQKASQAAQPGSSAA